jgi:PAS domain S-box-containing protein
MSPDSPDGFRSLVDAMYDAILLVRPDGTILDVNARAVEMLGFTRDELRSHPLRMILSGFEAKTVESLMPALHKGGFALIQAWCLRKDPNPSRFAAEVAVSLFPGKPERLGLFIRDVTRRHQAETLLQTGFNAMQNAASGILILDTEGRIEYANPSAASLWRNERESDLLGLSFSSLAGEEEDLRRILETAGLRQESWHGELKARRKDGTEFIVQVVAACNRNARQLPIGTVLSVIDVTGRHDAERAVRQAEQQQAMLVSLGAACHHLAQPATVLVGNMGLLQLMAGNLPSDVQEIIQSNVDAADRLSRILHHLNEVEEYRTTPYLNREAPEQSNLLLDI